MARPAKRLSVSGEDKLELEKLLASGVAQVRVVLRALALRQMADGRSAPEAAGMVRLTGKAVRELAHRPRNDSATEVSKMQAPVLLAAMTKNAEGWASPLGKRPGAYDLGNCQCA
jgi:hypothetical protein